MLGTTLGGRYQIYRYLGGGGFGRTYLAHDQHLPGTPDCVVKQLKPRINHPRAYDTACRLFNREAEVLYLLGEHAQIPRLFAHFEEQQEFYLVQEFVDGEVLSRSLRTGHCMGEIEALQLLKELLTILVFVHEQGVIHRDIKPSNLIRRRDGALMLIDFGGVKQINSDPDGDWTATTMAIGSAGYMPNEQLAGRPRYSSDIYAAGMVVLRAVTGRSPSKLPEEIRTGEICWRDRAPQIGDPLADIITNMTRYDFRERYVTAAETLAALAKIEPAVLATATSNMSEAIRVDTLAAPEGDYASKSLTDSRGASAKILPFLRSGECAKTQRSVSYKTGVQRTGLRRTEAHGLRPIPSFSASCEAQLPADSTDDNTVTESMPSERLPAPRHLAPPPPSQMYGQQAKHRHESRRNTSHRDQPSSMGSSTTATSSNASSSNASSSNISSSNTSSSDHYRSQGDQHFQNQQYGHAITAYGLSLRANPDDYILWFKQAMALEHLNHHEEAIACYHKVLKLQHQDYFAWSKLGKALETLERYDEAVDAYTQVLQIQPQNYWAWHDQGRALEASQHFETAIASYDQAIQLKPDFQLAIDSRKRLLCQLQEVDRLYHLQHYDEALQSCLETVQTNPNDPLAWLTQGMTLENAQYYQAAVEAYEKVLSLDPQDTLAQFRRAGVLEKLGRYQEAAIAYRNVTRLQSQNYWAWNDLGRMLETLQRYDHAMVAYNKALALQPTLETAIAGRDRVIAQLQQRSSGFKTTDTRSVTRGTA
ncbi:MAG: tetratricopeptide repeat protein [Cyanothece sp. SIO2G6]|nr:tetratricopeptide repeat protein [Cyanothece sp. SIO2G6]